MADLTAIVLTKDEEKNLPDCLSSLRGFASRVVVVDSGSTDRTVDIARESADIILLEKELMVLEQGAIEGRRIYANIIKYIKMTASSNFGNMFSVLAASAS